MISILPHWLRDNFKIKASMFVLAVLLWFLVVIERTYEHVLDIPLLPVNVKEGKLIANLYPRTARVKFQATGKELLRMRFLNHPSLQVNLSTINFWYKFEITEEMVVVAGGVDASVLEVLEPDSVLFVLDDEEVKNLVIHSNLQVSPAPGYVILEVLLQPDTSRVTGPKKAIGEISEINTDTATVLDVRRNTELVLNLIKPDILNTTIYPEQVEALVKVERIGEQQIIGIAVEVENSPSYRTILVEPGSVDLKLSGAVSLLTALEKDQIKAKVDYLQYNPHLRNRIPVRVDVGPGIIVEEISPVDVRLIVRRK